MSSLAQAGNVFPVLHTNTNIQHGQVYMCRAAQTDAVSIKMNSTRSSSSFLFQLIPMIYITGYINKLI